MRAAKKVRRPPRSVSAGEDITCPSAIARNGTIRIRSERAAQVARWFGLARRVAAGSGCDATDAKTARDAGGRFVLPSLSLRPGSLTLITGASGAGKSSLLRATREAHPQRRWIDLVTIAAPDAPLVDCFDDLPLRATLELLARVGLAEAWSYLRTPAELSEGQRWRFRLARAIHEAARHPDDAPVIACDEFAAVLDRVTAIVVAHRLRRAIDVTPHAAAVVATSHEDIEPALAAEVIVRCDFGRIANEQRETESNRQGRQERKGRD